VAIATLRQKILAITMAAFFLRVGIQFLLPREPSNSLAPDEEIYSTLTKTFGSVSISESFKLFLNSEVLGRPTVLPASFLYRFGIDELIATRMISSAYGFLLILILGVVLIHTLESKNAFTGITNLRVILIAYGLFAIWPSQLLWSSLALRESAMAFYTASLLVLVVILEQVRRKWTCLLLVMVFIPLLFLVRPPVGWLMTVVLLFYSAWHAITKKSMYLLVSVLLGGFLGYLLTSTNFFPIENKLVAIDVSTNQVSKSQSCNVIGMKFKAKGKQFICRPTLKGIIESNGKNFSESLLENVTVLPQVQEVRQLDANSRIQTLWCPFEPTSELKKMSCVVWRAPYMAFTFVVRPLPFIDTTSASSKIAGVENSFWMLIFGLLIVYRRQIAHFKSVGKAYLLPAIFGAAYVLSAGSYQGNMGTAFRHKSLILPIVFFYLLAGFINKSELRKGKEK
jgi:hypothetical protein